MITEVTFSNFRGGTLSVPLTGLDIITGMNGIGKTRILQAVQLAISGTVPHPIEERNIETAELFTRQIGRDTLTVGLTLDGPLPTFERIFSRSNKNGSETISQEFSFPDKKDEKVKAGTARLAELFGSFPIMLDVHKFIRMSDEQRAQLMLSIGPFDPQKWNEASLREIIVSHGYENELDQEVIRKAFEANKEALTVNIRAGIIDLIEWFKKEESSLAKSVKQFTAAAQGNVALNQTDGKTSMRPLPTIAAELEQARKDYTQLSVTIRDAKASRDAYQRSKETLKRLEVALAELPTVEELQKSAKTEEEFLESSKPALEELKKQKEEAEHIQAELDGCTEKDDTPCPICGQAAGRPLELARMLQSVNARIIELQEVQRAVDNSWNMVHTFNARIREREDKEHQKKAILDLKPDTAVNIEEMELTLEALKKKGESLSKEHTDRVTYDANLAQIKKAAASMKEAEEGLKTVKAVREQLRLIRWQIVKETLEPIRAKTSYLFSSVWSAEASFEFRFEDARGNEVFKFGWNIENELGNIFVDFDSLSTAQQLFTLVAVLSPLIEMGSPKFRLLMLDNCEVIHAELRSSFVHLLAKAKEMCSLDNILIASSSAQAWGIDASLGYEHNVIELDPIPSEA